MLTKKVKFTASHLLKVTVLKDFVLKTFFFLVYAFVVSREAQYNYVFAVFPHTSTLRIKYRKIRL